MFKFHMSSKISFSILSIFLLVITTIVLFSFQNFNLAKFLASQNVSKIYGNEEIFLG